MLIKSIKNDGVSPVIGVILMVAVTVILSAVIGSFVLDLGSNVSANPQAGVTFDQEGGTVTVQAVSMENADSLSVRAPDGTEAGTIGSVGGTVEVSAASGESVTVIGERDGKEAVIQSFTNGASGSNGASGPAVAASYDVTFQNTADGNKYIVDGTQQDSITVARGDTIEFNVDANTHPFHVATASGGGDFSNIYSSGVSVDNPSSSNSDAVESGTLTFTVQSDAPNTLYYACGVHNNMGGTITVTD